MLNLIINYLRDLLRPKHDLLLENLALRQQILVLERQPKKLVPVLAVEKQTQGLWPAQRAYRSHRIDSGQVFDSGSGWYLRRGGSTSHRIVGTTKRDCLNHLIIFNERHARNVLKKFYQYYHDKRDQHCPTSGCCLTHPPLWFVLFSQQDFRRMKYWNFVEGNREAPFYNVDVSSVEGFYPTE